MLRKGFAVVLLGLLMPAGAALAQSSTGATANAAATLDDGIALAKVADLDFGSIVPSGLAGTVAIDAAGTAVPSGGVTLLASPRSSAAFSVTKVGPGSKKFSVTLPASAVLVHSLDASKTMSVDRFTHNALPAAPWSKVPYDLTVGATLNVGVNQTPGFYTGTFDVTVIQQ